MGWCWVLRRWIEDEKVKEGKIRSWKINGQEIEKGIDLLAGLIIVQQQTQ